LYKILADENIYKLKEFFPQNVGLTTYNSSSPFPKLDGFDALFVRTVSKINQSSITEFPDSLKVIGTGSSGSDHIDKEYFSDKGINIIDAKGCNANAVSEYVITALLLWSIKRNKDLTRLRVGIVGSGKTGSAVQKQCEMFEIETISYDPPKQERDSNFISGSIKDLLECDILTFHVPLSKNGDYSTYHWLDKEILESHRFDLIINASRGGVIDELSLMEALDKGTVNDVIIDVWENEPDFNTALVEKSFLSTPHIAGYSEQAKLNASKMLVQKLTSIFDIDICDSQELYAPKVFDIANLNYSKYEFLLRLNPLREYDADIRNLCLRPDKAILFQKLRIDRPYRYEYPFLQIDSNFLEGFNELTKLGITPK